MKFGTSWNGMRGGRIALLATVAFVLATVAMADSHERRAAEQDVVTSFDRVKRTVVIGAETYRLAPKATILDESGRPIRLGEVSMPPEGRLVEFEVEKSGRGGTPMLRRLQLVDGDFE